MKLSSTLASALSSAAILASGCNDDGTFYMGDAMCHDASYAGDAQQDASYSTDTGTAQPPAAPDVQNTPTPDTYVQPSVVPAPTSKNGIPQDIKNAIAVALAAKECYGLNYNLMAPTIKVFSWVGVSEINELTFCTDGGNNTQRMSQMGKVNSPNQDMLFLQTLTKNPQEVIMLGEIIGQQHLAIVQATDLNPNGTLAGEPSKVDLIAKPDGSCDATYLQHENGNWKEQGTKNFANCVPMIDATTNLMEANWANPTNKHYKNN